MSKFLDEENSKKILILFSLGIINGLINSEFRISEEASNLMILPDWNQGDILEVFYGPNGFN